MKINFVYLSYFLLFINLKIFSVSDWSITNQGTYILADDIPASTGDATNGTINIKSSYVTLDLNGRFISQTSSGGTAGAIGIVVDAGLTDVVIKNGTIKNYLGSGVKVNSNCLRVSLQNLIVESCATRGIELDGAAGNLIQESEIKNCKIYNCCTTSSSDVGLRLVFCYGLNVTDVVLDNLLSANPSTFIGIQIDSSLNCLFNNVSVVNSLIPTGGFTGFGISSNSGNCQGHVFNECFVSTCSVTVSGAGYSGFSISGANTSKNLFKKCKVISCVSTQNISGFSVAAANNVFDKCIVTNNVAINNLASGFIITGLNNIFIECIATNNLSKGTTIGYGANSNDIILYRCISSYNNCVPGSSIGLSLTNSDCEIRECDFSKNNSSSGDASSYGIRWTAGSNAVFAKNISCRNGSTSNTNNITGVSFALGSQTGVSSTTMATPTNTWTNLALAS